MFTGWPGWCPHCGARPRQGSSEVGGLAVGRVRAGHTEASVPSFPLSRVTCVQSVQEEGQRRSAAAGADDGTPAPSCSMPNHFRYPEVGGGRWAPRWVRQPLPPGASSGERPGVLPPAPSGPHLACCAPVTSSSSGTSSVPRPGSRGQLEVRPQGPHAYFLCQRNTKPSRFMYCMMERKKYLMFPKKTVYFVLCKVFIK